MATDARRGLIWHITSFAYQEMDNPTAPL